MSTIRDVAKHANVSIATVSRVLNNDTQYKITDETRMKVWQAVSHLNYAFSPKQKQPMRTHHKSHSKINARIGCVLSVTKNKYHDPYFMAILTAVEERLLSKGYSIVFIRTGAELDDSQILYNTFNEPINGLILMETLKPEIYEYIKTVVPHIVGIDTDRLDIDNVGYDHYRVSSLAVNHLIEKGHTKIGYIGGSGTNHMIKCSRRYSGYFSSMHAAGLEVNKDWVIDCQWDEKLCIEKVNEICKSNNLPTAFLVGSDLMAIAALNAFFSNGIKVPKDISVIGMSNIEMSSYSNPPLTTINVPTEQIGFVAADLIIERIEGNNLMAKRVILPTELVVRSST